MPAFFLRRFRFKIQNALVDLYISSFKKVTLILAESIYLKYVTRNFKFHDRTTANLQVFFDLLLLVVGTCIFHGQKQDLVLSLYLTNILYSIFEQLGILIFYHILQN